MAGIAHLGTGFAFKRLFPSLSLWIILFATELLDIIWMALFILGIESLGNAAWSHSLLMALVWSISGGIVFTLISRNLKKGGAFGLIVFSHWLLDLITHPMGAISGNPAQAPDLPLAFGNTPQVGLGLYNHSLSLVIFGEIGLTALGLALFLTRKKNKKSV